MNPDMVGVPEDALAREVVRRFRLEPRCDWKGGASWLIAYDKDTRSYVKSPDSARKYYKFWNSDQALTYLITLL